MTVKELRERLPLDENLIVEIMPEDIEVSAVMCKGIIFLDGGVLVMKEEKDDKDRG